MKIRTRQQLLRYLPPLILALAGAISIAVPFIWPMADNTNYWFGFLVSACIAGSGAVVSKVKQFSDSAAEQAFLISIILGGASYFLPTVLFIIPIMWMVLLFRIESLLRTVVAAILGLIAVVATFGALIFMFKINCPWADFFAPEQLWGWIPVGIFSVAWISITILRRTLRVR